MLTFSPTEPVEIKLKGKIGQDFLIIRSRHNKSSYKLPIFRKKNIHTVRFWAQKEGEYFYFLAGKKHIFKVRIYRGRNQLILNGPLITKANYLTFANHEPLFPLIDTWWYGLSIRTKWSDFVRLVKKRKKQGFNMVMMVVGIPPEIEVFSPYAGNEGGQFLNKKGKINDQYFIEVDKKVKYLVDNGIIPMLLGGWGWQISVLGLPVIKKIWREIVSRYHAWPVIFCLCGEADLLKTPVEENLEQNQTYRQLKKLIFKSASIYKIAKLFRGLSQNNKNLHHQVSQWNKIGGYVKDLLPSPRLLTVHVHQPKTAMEIFSDPFWLDINTIQSGHSWHNAGFMVETILKHSSGNRLFINLEPWYEQILGRFGADKQRYAFWLSVLSGAKGFAYGANGIWQMSKKGENFLSHWGKADWQKALSYPGATQIGLGKKYLKQFSWWNIKPLEEVIFPHWEKDHLQYPLAASLGKEFLMVYFPSVKTKNYRINFSKASNYSFFWISPLTLKTIQTDNHSGKIENIHVPERTLNSDLLLVVKKGQ
ncbi:DUF4038 domain-containing protein [Candidatus Microgenomates bacterium]|nr:DUF4038 domain-containing protein [Candidatus Microgenomates bacterium]